MVSLQVNAHKLEQVYCSEPKLWLLKYCIPDSLIPSLMISKSIANVAPHCLHEGYSCVLCVGFCVCVHVSMCVYDVCVCVCVCCVCVCCVCVHVCMCVWCVWCVFCVCVVCVLCVHVYVLCVHV